MTNGTGPDLRRAGVWVIVWGILLIVAGMVAIVAPGTAAIATALLLAWLFVFAGIVQLVYAFQQHAHVTHSLLIFFRRAQSLDARAETAFDVILQARARRFAVNFNVAGAELKSSID